MCQFALPPNTYFTLNWLIVYRCPYNRQSHWHIKTYGANTAFSYYLYPTCPHKDIQRCDCYGATHVKCTEANTCTWDGYQQSSPSEKLVVVTHEVDFDLPISIVCIKINTLQWYLITILLWCHKTITEKLKLNARLFMQRLTEHKLTDKTLSCTVKYFTLEH